MPHNKLKFLNKAYEMLRKSFGPQHWWPGDTPFEIIVGAILTQNTNWTNVEKALDNIKTKNLLSAQKLYKIPINQLAQLIKPAGYFNVKAKRLKNFLHFFFQEYKGKIDSMKNEPLDILRKKLLSVNGIGPETADSILLYAFDKPSFVVDAYTLRFLYRHNIVKKGEDYHVIKDLFEQKIKPSVRIYNEYHALIVRLGKDYCRPKPLCAQCPLNQLSYKINDQCPHCYRAITKSEIKLKLTLKCSECAS